METFSLCTHYPIQSPRALSLGSPKCMNCELPNIDVAQNLGGRLNFPMVEKVPRRWTLFVGFSSILLNVHPISAAPMFPDMKEPEVIRTLKLASGVRIQGNSLIYGEVLNEAHDIIDGKGQEAREGDTVEINYVCRRSNGYFVYSTVDQFSGESNPVILALDDKQIIKGLKEVLVGMKAGGKRRALIPPSLGYINDSLRPIPDEFGPRRSLMSHANEPLVFEVQLLKVLLV